MKKVTALLALCLFSTVAFAQTSVESVQIVSPGDEEMILIGPGTNSELTVVVFTPTNAIMTLMLSSEAPNYVIRQETTLCTNQLFPAGLSTNTFAVPSCGCANDYGCYMQTWQLIQATIGETDITVNGELFMFAPAVATIVSFKVCPSALVFHCEVPPSPYYNLQECDNLSCHNWNTVLENLVPDPSGSLDISLTPDGAPGHFFRLQQVAGP